MSSFISALTGTDGISSTTMWADVTAAVPFIVLIFTFAFGYRVLRKLLKGGSKGKVSI